MAVSINRTGTDTTISTTSGQLNFSGSLTRFSVPGAGIDNTSAALSGTTPSVDVGARDTYTLTTSGNTTFTFTSVPSVELQPLEQAERNIRSRRDGLLQETDWIVIKSYERGENIPAQWEVYRQALRDITAQAGFPYSVEWPTKP